MLHTAHWKCRTQKLAKKSAIWAPSHNFIGLFLRNYRHVSTIGKNLLSSNISCTCPYNMVNFSVIATEIVSLVWGTSAIMAALCNRAGRYIFALWFLSFYLSVFLSFYLSIYLSIFFPCLISTATDWMSTILLHIWRDPSANLECTSEMCCTRLAANTGRKKSPIIAIWAPSHNFVGLFLRN